MSTAPTPAATAAVFGCTGFVGSHILAALVAAKPPGPAAPAAASAPFYTTVHTVSRRDPSTTQPVAAALSARSSSPSTPFPELKPTLSPDIDAWPRALGALAPPPTTVFSAVGTTRSAAGSIAAQWRVDHDANVALVRAARAAGARVFVFVSSGGTDGPRALAALSPYVRMKRGVHDALREAGFDGCAVVLKPGVIMGDRHAAVGGGGDAGGGGLSRWAERAFQAGVGALPAGWRDAVGHDARVIARAAVAAARIAERGEAKAKYWVLDGPEILRLGRDEWKEEGGEERAPTGKREDVQAKLSV